MWEVIHDLKTWPEPFEAVWSGVKTYEIRKDDRDYKVGDTLQLNEWDPSDGTYSGRSVTALVTYLTRGAWGIPDGIVVMGILAPPHCRRIAEPRGGGK